MSEPTIMEPMAFAFDGDGKMFVVEMRTYMQDIDGTGELRAEEHASRCTNRRRAMASSTSTASISITSCCRAWCCRSMTARSSASPTRTTSPFIATRTAMAWLMRRKTWYQRRRARRQHGASAQRPRCGVSITGSTPPTIRIAAAGTVPSKPALEENTAPNGGQWGLAQDDYGKMWWSNAGGEKGIWNYQAPILYAAINVKQQKSELFDTVWPIVALGSNT